MIFSSQPLLSIQKLHKPVFNGIGEALKQIFTESKHADKVIEQLLKRNKQWGSRDRKLIAETVYDIVRNFRLLSFVSETETNYWFITGVYLMLRGVSLPAWPEFTHINRSRIEARLKEAKNHFEILQSIPDELNETGINEMGREKWEQEVRALNEQAKVVIRANTIKTTPEDLIRRLKEEGIEAYRLSHDSNTIIITKRSNLFNTTAFKSGLFELQDAGSQEIGNFCEAKSGEFIIDACAGAGGKSLQLAANIGNKGKIISMDVAAYKLDRLMDRAKRAGIHCIEARPIGDSEPITRLKGKADLLLLDVPCSGTGVLKRNPDTKWKFHKSEYEKTKLLQAKIVDDYSVMVKTGGRMIYSTCSIFPGENQEQMKRFLKNHPEFEMQKERLILPSEGFDGFYMCLLKKTTNHL